MTRSLNILWVKCGTLFPLNSGGRLRTNSMLNELARRHKVTYLALLPRNQTLDREEPDAPYAQQKIWISNFEPPKYRPAFFLGLLKNLLFSKYPVVLDRYRNRTLSNKLSELDASGNYDLIVCDFLAPAPNFDFDRLTTPTVLFQHNVEAQIWKRLAQGKTRAFSRWYFQSQYERLRRIECDLSAKFDGVITVSPEDANLCRREYGLDNVLGAVPTGVDTEAFRPPAIRTPQKGLIGFLGSMDWMPNIECVQYFARDILPKIRAQRPDCQFRIIGRNPAPAVWRLGEDDPAIEITGTVADVRPYLDDCEVLVVPLRSGGGTRIKIFEAMAQGVPVVSTSIGAEGLPVEDEKTILIADTEESFADAVVRILNFPELGATLSDRARAKLVAEHSWASVTDAFVEHCESALKEGA